MLRFIVFLGLGPLLGGGMLFLSANLMPGSRGAHFSVWDGRSLLTSYLFGLVPAVLAALFDRHRAWRGQAPLPRAAATAGVGFAAAYIPLLILLVPALILLSERPGFFLVFGLVGLVAAAVCSLLTAACEAAMQRWRHPACRGAAQPPRR